MHRIDLYSNKSASLEGVSMIPAIGKKGLVGLLIGAIIVFNVFPFFWAVVTSLRTGSELFNTDLLPKNPTVTNYVQVFREQSFALHILNSVSTATLTVLISIGLGFLAAYALSRDRFQGRRLILQAFLLISIFPQIGILSGLFELIRALGLYNRKFGLSLTYIIITLPMTVWLLTHFLRQIPRQIEEAAIIDGAGTWTIITRILIPLMAPSLVTTGLLAFIAAWNEFLFAYTFTLTDESITVPVSIAQMSGASAQELPWGNIMAASVIVTLPIVALVLIFERRIVSGLTAAAVKG
jgi:trehalose/maltose transport system permease protein